MGDPRQSIMSRGLPTMRLRSLLTQTLPTIRSFPSFATSHLGVTSTAPHKRSFCNEVKRPRIQRAPSRSGSGRDTLLITLTGDDSPGITSEFSKVLHDAGCELLDTNQATIHGKLCLYFLLDVNHSDQKLMLSELLWRSKDFPNLDCKFEMLDPTTVNKQYNQTSEHVVTLIGRRVSFRSMHAVTEQIAESGFNIKTINQLSNISPQGLAWRELDEQAEGKLNTEEMKVGGFDFDGSQATSGEVKKEEWDAWASTGKMSSASRMNLTRAIEMRIDGEESADAAQLQDQLLRLGRELSCDIALQKEATLRRVKRLVVMDMDSTLIQQEVIDEIARHHGVYDKVAEMTEYAMQGGMDFDESLRVRCKELAGCPAEVLDEVYKNIKLTPGAVPFVSELQKQGYKIGVLSGGFNAITQRVAADLGLDFAFANDLEVVNGKLTGEVVGPIVNRERKRDLMLSICQSLRISTEQAIAVGDGANDLEMLKAAGLGIAFNAKPKVQEMSKYTINTNRLDSILYLLGVRASDMKDTAPKQPDGHMLNFTNRI